MDTLYGLISKISTGDQNGVDKQLVSKIDLDENLDDALGRLVKILHSRGL